MAATNWGHGGSQGHAAGESWHWESLASKGQMWTLDPASGEGEASHATALQETWPIGTLQPRGRLPPHWGFGWEKWINWGLRKSRLKKKALFGRLYRQVWGCFTVQQTCTFMSAAMPQKSRGLGCSARNAYTSSVPSLPALALSLDFPNSVLERFFFSPPLGFLK